MAIQYGVLVGKRATSILRCTTHPSQGVTTWELLKPSHRRREWVGEGDNLCQLTMMGAQNDSSTSLKTNRNRNSVEAFCLASP